MISTFDMKKITRYISAVTVALAFLLPIVSFADVRDNSVRKERNYLREGNKLYREKRYAEAEVAYRKAIEENANSEVALYNLAASLIRQGGSTDPQAQNSPLAEAQSLLSNLAQASQDIEIAEKAAYNLGNMAFNRQQYDQAVEYYKKALRKNPENDLTRENLRLAQLKLQQQQQDQQNKDQNKDQDKDQQDQQNKDQNKDQDKNQDQDNQQQQKQDQPKEQNPQQQQGSISDENAAQILKTMENEENATRRKLQDMQKKEGNANRRPTGPQW